MTPVRSVDLTDLIRDRALMPLIGRWQGASYRRCAVRRLLIEWR